MEQTGNQGRAMSAKEFTDVLVRVGLVGLMVILCFRIFNPFMNLMLWALILAVTVYPVHQKLTAKLGGKNGRASTIIVLIGLLLLGVPFGMLASSAAEHLVGLHAAYQAGTIVLPAPKESVSEWPLIGQQVYDAWSAASASLPDFIEANKTAIESMIGKGVSMGKSAAGGVFMFLGALIVAGIMMAFGEGGSQSMLAIFERIAGPGNGASVHKLSVMTTRSVAVGVLGVAIIQGVLMGLGFMLAGVPAPGILALIVLLLAIMQLPATIIGIPVIIWLWNSGDAGSTMNVFWSVYIILAGLSDNFLKPVLLGRGVDAPMPVILIGALGGMISSGFMGLFTGAVILAVGYRIFMQWVDQQALAEDSEAAGPEATQ